MDIIQTPLTHSQGHLRTINKAAIIPLLKSLDFDQVTVPLKEFESDEDEDIPAAMGVLGRALTEAMMNSP